MSLRPNFILAYSVLSVLNPSSVYCTLVACATKQYLYTYMYVFGSQFSTRIQYNCTGKLQECFKPKALLLYNQNIHWTRPRGWGLGSYVVNDKFQCKDV